MNESDNREQELKQKEEELQAKEREIRLKELEIEVYQQYRNTKISSSELPLHHTQKHKPSGNQLKTIGKKIVGFAQFICFVVVGFSLVRFGLLIGLWLTHIAIIAIIAFIGYQIFLNDSDKSS